MPMANRGRSKLSEEASEVIQVAAKADAVYGLDNPHWQDAELGTLRQRMEDELGDLYAAMAFIIDKERLDLTRIQERRDNKFALFCKWDMEPNS